MTNYLKSFYPILVLGILTGGCAKLATPESENSKSISPAKVEKKQLTTVWSFNEGEGRLCKPDNDKDKPLSIVRQTRSPLWSKGVKGEALCFLGRGFARGSAPEYFNLEEPFTIDFFVKRMNPSEGICGGLYEQMHYLKAGFRIVDSKAGDVLWKIQRTSADENFSIKGPRLELGKWYHLAFVNDNENLSIYCDGKLSATKKLNGRIKQTSLGKDGNHISNKSIKLGYTGGNKLNFNGLIDELRLSNFARKDFSMERKLVKNNKAIEKASKIKIKKIHVKSDTHKKNLLENGSFESDLTLWNKKIWGVPDPANSGSLTIVDDQKNDGKKSCCLDRMANIALTAQLVPVKPGDTYTFSADIKTDHPSTHLYMRAYSPRETYVRVKTKKHIKPTSDWKRYSFTFKIPENWTDRLSCDFYVSKSLGKIWIDRVMVLPGKAKETTKPKIMMGLTTPKPGNVFWKGEKVQVNLDIMNSIPDKGNILFQVMNIDNNLVFEKKLPAKSQIIDLPLGLGLYSIHASHSNPETDGVSVSNRIAVLPQKEASKFFGMHYRPYNSWSPHSIIDKDLTFMNLWGVGSIRTDFISRQAILDVKPGSHSMYFFKSAQRHKLSVLLCLAGNSTVSYGHAFNLKKRDIEADFVTDEDLVQWEKDIAGALKNLDSYIDYIEVLNEPNCMRSPGGKRLPGDEYMKVVEKTYEIARQQAPSAKVVAGSVTGLTRSRFQFFEEMLRKEENRKFFDALSFHPYGGSNEDDVYKDVLCLRKVIDEFCPDIPLLATELGGLLYENPAYGIKIYGGELATASVNCFASCTITNGERIQAKRMIKTLLACKTLGVKIFIWHIWGTSNRGTIMDMQGNGTLMLGAYGFLSRFLKGVDSLKPIKLGDALRTFAYKLPDGGNGVFIWTVGKGSKAQIKLKTKPENIVIRDITGFRRQASATSADSVTLELSHMPRLIIARDLTAESLKKCLKDADLTGLEGVVSSHVSIPSPKEIQLRLKSKTNKPQSFSDAKLILSNNKRREIIPLKDMVVRADKYLTFNFPLKNKLTQGLTGVTLSAKLNGNVDFSSEQNIRLVNSYKVKDIKADGNLDDWRNFTPIQLGKKNLKKYSAWNGPDDHNAKLWLGYDKKNFYIAAEVTDDKHINTGRTPWRGDSVQIYFDPLCDSQQAADRDVDDFEFILFQKDLKEKIFYRHKVAQFELSGMRDTGEIPEKLVKRSIVRKGDKTIYEIIIPKEQLTPTEFGDGKSLRFSLFINDNDKILPSGEKKMEKRDSGLSLTGKGSEPYKNHKEWSEILFIDK